VRDLLAAEVAADDHVLHAIDDIAGHGVQY